MAKPLPASAPSTTTSPLLRNGPSQSGTRACARHRRTGAAGAKIATPASPSSAAVHNANTGEIAATQPATTSGPATKIISCMAESTAYARSNRSLPTMSGHRTRRHGSSGGVAAPARTAPASTTTGSLGATAIAMNPTDATTAVGTRTRTCPTRST